MFTRLAHYLFTRCCPPSFAIHRNLHHHPFARITLAQHHHKASTFVPGPLLSFNCRYICFPRTLFYSQLFIALNCVFIRQRRGASKQNGLKFWANLQFIWRGNGISDPQNGALSLLVYRGSAHSVRGENPTENRKCYYSEGIRNEAPSINFGSINFQLVLFH